jgi:deoxyribonuclease V
MIAAADVAYRSCVAAVACVLFKHWMDDAAAAETTCEVSDVAPYEAGQFFRRELPCLLAVLRKLEQLPGIIVIDGYVWLADESKPGLGGHLYAALERQVAVIGVAKTRFRRAGAAVEITRGASGTPLYITAAGIPLEQAASNIKSMHGSFRIPTLLRRVDQLCRGLVSSQP